MGRKVALVVGILVWCFGISYAARADVENTDAAPVERILYIGDSHSVGTFGHHLDTLLRTIPGAEVVFLASCGSAPQWWMNGHATTCGWFQHRLGHPGTMGLKAPTPIFETEIQKFHPTTIIIEQGANQIFESLDGIARDTQKMGDLVSASGATRCLWIGPPNGRNKPEPKMSELEDTIRKTITPTCQYFSSRPFTHYPATGGDGQHYDSLGAPGRAIARAWADQAFKTIQEILQ